MGCSSMDVLCQQTPVMAEWVPGTFRRKRHRWLDFVDTIVMIMNGCQGPSGVNAIGGLALSTDNDSV